MSTDFLTGSYNSITKVFTAYDGTQYYISANNLLQKPILRNLNYSSSPCGVNTSMSSFSDRSSTHRYVGPIYSWFSPNDLPNERF